MCMVGSTSNINACRLELMQVMQNIMHISDDDRNRTAAGHCGAVIYLGNAVYRRDSLLHGFNCMQV